MEALHQPLNNVCASSPLAGRSQPASARPLSALCPVPSSSSSSSSLSAAAATLSSHLLRTPSCKLPAIGATTTAPSRRRAVIVMRSSAAGGYAAALADVARSQNALEAINTDMEKVGRFLQDKQLFGFLNNPTIKDDTKKSILKRLAQELGFSPYTLNLLCLIVDKKRTALLLEVVKEFGEIYNEMTNTEVAIVTSAVKVDTAHLTEIAKKIQSMSGAKNVRMKNLIDSSVIAGFIVRFGKDGSRLIDMSVKGQLDRIAQRIDLSTQQTGTVTV